MTPLPIPDVDSEMDTVEYAASLQREAQHSWDDWTDEDVPAELEPFEQREIISGARSAIAARMFPKEK